MLQKIISNKKYLFLGLLSLTFIIYLPTLFFHYVYLDDYLMVQEPGFHNNLKNIPGSFFRSLWAYSTVSYQYYRPVSISLYILGTWTSQQMFAETLPWIFHLTNIVLQIGVVALLFHFLILIGASLGAAGIATLLFIVHPVFAGTVSWIPGQNELLLAVFILSAFIALIKYVNTNGNHWLILHVVFFWLALLTKENAIILPILSSLYFLSAGHSLKSVYKIAGGWAISIGLWFAMLKFGASQNNPVTESVLLSIFKHMHYSLVYLGKIFIPSPLSTLPTFYDTPTVIVIAATLALIFFTILFLIKQKRWILLFGIAWFTGFLLPTFAMAGLQSEAGFILREDRGYLAAIGVWIIFLQISWPRKIIEFRSLIIGLITLLFIGLNLIHQQNYRSGKSFYTNAIAESPHLAFAYVHLADMYLPEKDFNTAIYHYLKAIELNPHEPQAHNNLGVAYMRSGQIELAIKEFRIELSHYPDNILALFNLGVLLFQKNQITEAEMLFRRAVTVNPVYTDAWRGLQTVYTLQKNEKGLEEVKKGLAQSEWDMSKGL